MKTIHWMALTLALLVTSGAQATIITGESATANFGPYLPLRGEQHAVDDSGLSAGDNTAVTADQTHSTSPDNNMWLGTSGEPNPTLTIDLGAGCISVFGWVGGSGVREE